MNKYLHIYVFFTLRFIPGAQKGLCSNWETKGKTPEEDKTSRIWKVCWLSLWRPIVHHSCLHSIGSRIWNSGKFVIYHFQLFAISGSHKGCTLGTLLAEACTIIFTLGLPDVAALWKYGCWKMSTIEIFQIRTKHGWIEPANKILRITL